MWFCIEKIANTSINNVYCSLSLKIEKYIYRKYQSQEIIIIVIGRFDSFTKIQLSNFGTRINTEEVGWKIDRLGIH